MGTMHPPEPAVKQRSRTGPDPAYLIGGGVFIAFIAFVQWYVGWSALLRPWGRLSVTAIVVAAALISASYGVRALRLYDYFHAQMRGRYPAVLKLTLQHNLWNNLLPMRAGEASFPILMARYFDVPWMDSLAALLWFRALDVHALAACAVAVLGGLWLGGAPAAVLVLAWMTLPWVGYRFGRRYAVRSAAVPPRGRAGRALRRLGSSLPGSPRDFWRAWGWTLLNWGVKFSALLWILRQFVPASVAAAALGVMAGDATSVLPIHSVAGAGTYEAGIVAGLAVAGAGIPPAAALAGAVNVHLFVLGTAFIGGSAAVFLPGRRAGG